MRMKYNIPKFVDTAKATNKRRCTTPSAYNRKAAESRVSNPTPIPRTWEKNRIKAKQAEGRK